MSQLDGSSSDLPDSAAFTHHRNAEPRKHCAARPTRSASFRPLSLSKKAKMLVSFLLLVVLAAVIERGKLDSLEAVLVDLGRGRAHWC